MRGKLAVVCGGTQGIGFASAVALAEHGCSVLLLARDAGRLDAAVGRLPADFPDQHHRTLVADLSDPAAAATALGAALGDGPPAAVLVNNTGGPPGGLIVDATPDAFLAAFRSHLIANHLLVQTVLPGMKAGGYGRIINVVSTSVKQPIPGLGVSNTTRGAVASWAKTLAGELGRYGITVNNVLPGATRTGRLDSIIAARSRQTGTPIPEIEAEMQREIPLGRFGEPREIAAAVAFLASPAGAYITGVSLAVDGGRIAGL